MPGSNRRKPVVGDSHPTVDEGSHPYEERSCISKEFGWGVNSNLRANISYGPASGKTDGERRSESEESLAWRQKKEC